MTLTKKIYADMVAAMKAKENIKKETLRLLYSEIKNQAKDTGKDVPDNGVLKLIKSALKKRHDALAIFQQAGRAELVDQAKTEIDVLEVYLPQQLSESELAKIISDTIQSLGAAGPKDTGRIIKEIMLHYGMQTDGKKVQKLVSAHFSN